MTKNTRDADVAFIQALAEVLRENDLTEVKVKREYGEDDSLDVRVSRQQPQQVMAAAVAAPVAAAPIAAAPAAAAWIEDNTAKGLPAHELYDRVTGMIATDS